MNETKRQIVTGVVKTDLTELDRIKTYEETPGKSVEVPNILMHSLFS